MSEIPEPVASSPTPEPASQGMTGIAAFDGGRFFEAGRMMLLPAGIPYRTLNSKAQVRSVTMSIDPARFREATRPWCVPTFNLVFADAEGHIGHQCVGRIPLRRVAERGYRPGWDPMHQWADVIPFEDMPHQIDPERGFVVITHYNRMLEYIKPD